MPARNTSPSTYSIERIDAICERMAQGEPLAKICRDPEMPGLRTVYDWRDAHPEAAEKLLAAREAGEEVIAASCMDICDEREGKAIMAGGEEVAVVFDSTAVQRNKLRIWTRLELLKKWNPKKWGDKVQHGGAHDLPPIRSERTLSDAELEAIARGTVDG